MSKFKELLHSTPSGRHDGQAIWKYQLSEDDFEQLKDLIKNTQLLHSLDPRDCVLYYAEWWKRCYNGGYPSKKLVFSAVANGQHFNEEDFYRHAKRGADLLAIRWIKGQNTQYFKTLLFQGGLPLFHIANNKGDYKGLLLKILELNPTSIDDFAFLSEITNMLPASGRNDEIYECCLAIVTAIINDDSEYLKLLEQSKDLQEITGALRIKKLSIALGKKKTAFRAMWVYEPDNLLIRLYLGLKDMNEQQFRDLFAISADQNLEAEYRLFYNEDLICKFIKLTDASMRLKWIGEHRLDWDGSDRLPDFSLVSTEGKKHDSRHLINYVPCPSRPSLWRAYSEKQWVMERGYHTAADTAMVLWPTGYSTNDRHNSENVSISGLSYGMLIFKDTITLTSENDQIELKTSQHKLDWVIQDNKPNWMNRANYTVVRNTPSILVFDELGQVASGAILRWRSVDSTNWHLWSHAMEPGLIEISIQLGTVTEYETIFNIAHLAIKPSSSDHQTATLTLNANPFIFSVGASPLYQASEISNNQVKLQLTEISSLPSSIQLLLRFSAQRSSLRFELHPPFKGVEIIDNTQQIVSASQPISIGSLNGLRLLSNQGQLRVNLWNTSRYGLLASESLSETFMPMRHFSEKIKQLYALSDPMDGGAEIKMEIVEEKNGHSMKLKEYILKRYDQQLVWDFDDSAKARIYASSIDVEVFAVPLDCETKELIVRPLRFENGYFIFEDNEIHEKFLVFARGGLTRFQPIFVSTDVNNVPTSDEDRMLRVESFVKELLDGGLFSESWAKLLAYYKICQQYHLPNSCFDILRASSWSSVLAAKLFVLLTGYESESFKELGCQLLEQDLGFSFHWIDRGDWGLAIKWSASGTDADFTSEIAPAIKGYMESQQPVGEFAKFAGFVLQDADPFTGGSFHVNTKISQLRGELGSKVLNELPRKYPKIPDRYKDIIKVTEGNSVVEILLRAPLVTALSVTGQDTAIWEPKNENKRRNIRYAQQLSPNWYAEALNYCLTKINTYEL